MNEKLEIMEENQEVIEENINNNINKHKVFDTYLKLTKSNKLTNIANKINKSINIYEDYEKEFKKTNKHIDTTSIIIGEKVSSGIVNSANLALSSEIGLSIASSGGFTPLSCIGGAIASTITFCTGLDLNDKIIKPYVKNTMKNTINTIKQIKNELPENIQDIIYECISHPIEETLKKNHNLIKETIDKIKYTVNSILCENWQKIHPNETIIYCEDLYKNKVSITLNKQISTKIYDYCRIGMNYYDTNYSEFMNNEFINSKQNLSNFALKYNNFKDNMNYFDVTTTKTPYEKLTMNIYRPNSKLLKRHYIDPNTIPDYRVNIIVDGKDSNNGILAGIGCSVIFVVKISFLF